MNHLEQLVSVIDDADLRQRVCSHVGASDERLRDVPAVPVEALMLAAMIEAFERGATADAPIGLVTNFFNQDARERLGRDVTPRWVGQFVRSTFGLSTFKSQGVFVIAAKERERVLALADRYGVRAPAGDEGSSDAQSAVSANEPEPEMMGRAAPP